MNVTCIEQISEHFCIVLRNSQNTEKIKEIIVYNSVLLIGILLYCSFVTADLGLSIFVLA